jgi:dolichyl-phosphate beta-glucosyltransferase
MGASPISLSLVVPAYNEAERIADSLTAIGAFLESRSWRSEIVVVDDGSRDSTFGVACGVAERLSVPVRIVRYAKNRGKGCALKVGFSQSRGDRILFSDADLSTPIEEAEALLARLDEGCDVVIGTRKNMEASIEVHQPWLRERLGRIYTRLVHAFIADVSDSTCGFKAFRGDVGRALFERVRAYDWSFDAEVLHLAERGGHRIGEVGVPWSDRAGTKVRLLRDVPNSLLGLVRIRLHSAAGHYREPLPLDFPIETWSNAATGDEAVAGGA